MTDYIVNCKVKIYSSPYILAEKFAEELILLINESAKSKKSLTVALSGGSTPELLFSILGDHFSDSAPWEFVHFFWGDERCVPSDSFESNFRMTKSKLFDKIDIPAGNIHRIIGEDNPEVEALRYSAEICRFTGKRDGLPLFDIIILGLGEDGHTASIFPGNKELLESHKVCEVAVHPDSKQKRITITGRVINNAEAVVFLVTGKKKAGIIEKIFNKSSSANDFPAAFIAPASGELTWMIDEEAGSLMKNGDGLKIQNV
jgi:6-phosphogluconolactonase